MAEPFEVEPAPTTEPRAPESDPPFVEAPMPESDPPPVEPPDSTAAAFWRWPVLILDGIAVAFAAWGAQRIVSRPDLPLDFGILLGVSGFFAWQAWRLAERHGVSFAALRGMSWLPGGLANDDESLPEEDVDDGAHGEEDSREESEDDRAPGEGIAPTSPIAPIAPAGDSRASADSEDSADTGTSRESATEPAPRPDVIPADWSRSTRPVLAMLGGLAIALLGQIMLDGEYRNAPDLVNWWPTVVAFAVAAGLWLWALARMPDAVEDAPIPVVAGPAPDPRRTRAVVAGLGLVALTAVVAPMLGDTARAWFGLLDYPVLATDTPWMSVSNSLTLPGRILWLGGMALYVYGLADIGAVRRWWRLWLSPDRVRIRVGGTGAALAAITALAAWYRFHDLDRLPRQMTSDHAEKLLDVATVVNGLRPIFMPANSGREPMQFYWIALLVALGLPLTFMTLKIGMSIVSMVTLAPMYRLGRLFGGRNVGLAAILILALLPWHIQITRIALRIALAPLWVALTLLVVYRALATGRRNDWLWTGLLVGLGMYTYSAYRPMIVAVPMIVILKLAHDVWRGRREVLSRALAGHLAAAAGLAAMVVAPLARLAIDRPGDLGERTATRLFGDTLSGQAQSTLAFLRVQDAEFFANLGRQFFVNARNAALMFNQTSDNAWFQSPPGRPAFETVGGALMILGLAVAAHRIWRRDWRIGTLVAIMPVMLLSSILALAFPDENPSLTRASAVLPMAVVIAALPLPVLAARLRAVWGPRAARALSAGLVAVLFVWMAQNTSARYFGEYRQYYDDSTHPTREAADVIRAFVALGGDLAHVHYAAWSNGWDHRLLGMEIGRPDWTPVMFPTDGDWDHAIQQASGHVSDPARKLYLVGGPLVQENIAFLKSLFPNAMVTRHRAHVPGKEFWSVFVPDQASQTTELKPE